MLAESATKTIVTVLPEKSCFRNFNFFEHKYISVGVLGQIREARQKSVQSITKEIEINILSLFHKDVQIFVPQEVTDETRVAITPETIKKFVQLGISVAVEQGAGEKSLISDIQKSNLDYIYVHILIYFHI